MKRLLNQFLQYPFFLILSSVIFSFIIMVFIFPDLFFYHNVSFIRFGDTEHNYIGIFAFLSNLYHGGIALWNNYDQMPLAFLYFDGGLVSFNNLITSIVYILISPFWRSAGEAFFLVYTYFYQIPSMLVRAVGIYLLIRHFTKNKIILFASLILMNTTFSPQFYLGLNSTSVYSFFPLLVHFILNIFERWRLFDILLFILTMAICIAMDALVAVGYFYQGLHFVILPALVWAMVKNRSPIKQIFHPKSWGIDKYKLGKISLTILLALAVLLPWVYLLKINYKDYDFQVKTRFDRYNFFDFTAYFNRDTNNANASDFFTNMINFGNNLWANDWLYLGYTALFLGLVAVLFSREKEKYIFSIAILFFWGINTPREMFSWQAVFHWINAYTNPFNVIVRSFHMTGAFLLPFLLLPMAALGMKAIFTVNFKEDKDLFRKIFIMAIFLGYLFMNIILNPGITADVRKSLVINLLLFCVIITFCLNTNKLNFRRKILIAILILVFILDGLGMKNYLRIISSQMLLSPQNNSGSKDNVLLDYQNPKVLPYRSFYNQNIIPQVSGYLYHDPDNMQGLYFRYTNLQKYFGRGDSYHPRHISYDLLTSTNYIQQYIKLNTSLIYQADAAVPADEENLTSLLDKGIADKVIMINQNPSLSDIYKSSIPADTAHSQKEIPTKTLEILFNKTDIVSREGLNVVSLPLPPDFPKYLSTGVFTADANLIRAKLDNRDLNPAQGKLLFPYAFDVQNYETGKLVISLPDDYTGFTAVTFTYPTQYSPEITNIWRNEPDKLGFDYKTDKKGWIVFHYPYDLKWRLTIDNKPVSLYKANMAFMAAPINSGTHKILLSYWPDTHIRLFMGISMILIVVVPFVIIFLALKDDICYGRD